MKLKMIGEIYYENGEMQMGEFAERDIQEKIEYIRERIKDKDVVMGKIILIKCNGGKNAKRKR